MHRVQISAQVHDPTNAVEPLMDQRKGWGVGGTGFSVAALAQRDMDTVQTISAGFNPQPHLKHPESHPPWENTDQVCR